MMDALNMIEQNGEREVPYAEEPIVGKLTREEAGSTEAEMYGFHPVVDGIIITIDDTKQICYYSAL